MLCDKEAARKAGKVKPSAAGVLAGAPPKAVSSLAPAAAGGRTPGGGVRASLAVERSSGHLGAPASVGADRRSSFGNFSARYAAGDPCTPAACCRSAWCFWSSHGHNQTLKHPCRCPLPLAMLAFCYIPLPSFGLEGHGSKLQWYRAFLILLCPPLI